MATRADVARRAGVSPSTVSYVLSGERSISPATRVRVERAMRELDYTPNAFARGLAGARKGIVAVHFPYYPQGLDTTSFEYIASASQRAQQRGYHLLLWSNPLDDLDGLTSLVKQGLVDGVLLMEVLLADPRIAVLQHSRTPFVTIGRPEANDGIIYVDDDFESLARQAIDHVADLGHRDVAFLTASRELVDRGHGPMARTERAIGPSAARRGLTLESLHVPSTIKAGHEAFARLRSMEPRPTAVLSFNELATSGLLHAAAMGGMKIPDDLSIVGLSVATAAAEMLVPPLTTVSPPSTVMAANAVDALTDVIEGAAPDVPQLLIEPTLTVRGSTAAPPRLG